MTTHKPVWVVRGTRGGESDSWLLEHDYVGVGFSKFPDLSTAASREDILALITPATSDESDKARLNWAAQLWAFVGRMQIGDLVVLPQRASRQINIGRITGDYEYVNDESAQVRHRRAVEWIRTGIPRAAFESDLLYSFGAFSTVFQVSRNDAAFRVSTVANPDAEATDPGPRAEAPSPSTPAAPNTIDESTDATDTTDQSFDLDLAIGDRVSARIRTRFKGHRLEELVAAVLEAKGFTITQRPEPGIDGGVDLLAGTGVFGMDSPRLVVQVKSETTPVGDPVVNALHGSIQREDADQGLLVALGDVNKRARSLLRGHGFRIAVWNEAKLLQAIFECYEQLPRDIQEDLPLQRRWVLVED